MTAVPLLIVNPRAGRGRAGSVFENIRRVVEARLGACEVASTAAPGDAIRIAREASAAGRQLVIAVGGDGTVHEVVNGLVEAAGSTKLGIVGAGTGGDLCRTLGIEHRLDRYLDAIVDGRDVSLDVGRLVYRDYEGVTRTRYFANILSMGLGGLVDRYVATSPQMLGGKAVYALSSLRAMANSVVGRLRCRITDEADAERTEEISSRMLAICNGRFFGSGMQIAPMARPDDGRFEVLALTATSRLAMALGMRSVYSGAHVRRGDVRHFACKRIAIDHLDPAADDRFLLDVDGEPLGRLPVDVELIRGAVTVRVPR